MKKNVFMRAALLMLVLTLITSVFVGGTFAKYITSVPEASDTARVAKWGVTGSVTGAAFATTYDLDSTPANKVGEWDLAVESSTEDKVVAPGTTGTFTGISLEGTPEVAVNVTTTATLTLEGWEVDGAYYCPIVITVNGTPYSGLDYDSAAEFIEAVEGAIEVTNGDYAPNTDLSAVENMNGNYTWAWAFSGDDAKDTALGDAAAADDAAIITLAVSCVITQID